MLKPDAVRGWLCAVIPLVLATAGLRAQQPSKEYIRLGGRVIAIETPNTVGFTLATAPGSITLQSGAAATVSVSVSMIGAFSGNVQLGIENLPQDVTASFSPSTLSVTGQSALTITAAEGAYPGTYQVRIVGTAGATVQKVPITVLIGGFTLSAAAGVRDGVAGYTATYTVSITGLNGFTGDVDLAATGLPADSAATFNPSRVTISDSTPVTSSLAIQTGAATPSGSYVITISAFSGTQARNTAAGIEVRAGAASLPFPWVAELIGNQTSGGSATYSNGTFNVTGSGVGPGLGATSDNLTFVYQPMTGDGTIVVRLAVSQVGNAANQAGIMLRDGLSPSAAYAWLEITGSNATSFVRRTAPGASWASEAGPTVGAPVWMNLVRVGDQFSAYLSGDGVDWQQVGTTQTISMGSTVYAGMLVARNTSLVGTPVAKFDNAIVSNHADFYLLTLPTSPSTRTVPAGGGTVAYTTSVVPINGFSGSVALSVDGLPSDVTGSFSPSSLPAGSHSVLTVAVGAGTPAGSYPMTVRATSGELVETAAITLNVVAGSVAEMPEQWSANLVGTTTSGGSTTYSNGTFTITGSGEWSGLGATWDRMQFVYQPMTGDGTIVIRLAVSQIGDVANQAGIMLRDGLSPSAAYAWLEITGANATSFVRRTAPGGSWASEAGPTVGAPVWMKLVRVGDQFSAYLSGNGVDWQQVGTTQTISMGTTIYAGMLVARNTPHNSTPVAKFDNAIVSNYADFYLLVLPTLPSTRTVPAGGGTVAYTTSVVPINAFSGSVALSVDGLPTDVTGSFSPSSLPAGSQSVLTVAVGAGTPTGSYPMTVRATSGELVETAAITLNVVAGSVAEMPEQWSANLVGTTTSGGSTTYSNGTFTITGSGEWSGLGATWDRMQFVYQPMTGDGTIVVRLAVSQVGNAANQAGIMLRDGLSPSAAYAWLEITGSNATSFVRRTAPGASWASEAGPTVGAPVWMKLVRVGDQFSAYLSGDGVDWQQVGTTQTISMGTTVYAGMLVARNTSLIGTPVAKFDNAIVSNHADFYLVSMPRNPPIRVNAGGSAYTDPQGLAWSADTGYSGGSTYSTSAAILNTTTPALYQKKRYGNFQYEFSRPNGSYNVTLKFAELTRTAPGQRSFNVSINGQQVLSVYDVFAESGGKNVAIDRTFPVVVSSGQITISFTTIVLNSIVNAIEIAPTTALYDVYAVPINGFSSQVALSAIGVPAGATATFGSDAISAPGSTTLSVTGTTGPILVSGTSGSLTAYTVAANPEVSASPAPPAPPSVWPDSGAGSQQVFVFSASDGAGSTSISSVQMLIGATLSGIQSCQIYYERAQNLLYLGNDAGTGFTGPLAAGSPGTLWNSQCSIDTALAGVAGDGSTLSVSVPITFAPRFGGEKKVYVAYRTADQKLYAYRQVGTWAVPVDVGINSVPVPGPISPSSGSGLRQVFAFGASDADGYVDITKATVLINTSEAPAGGCQLTYYPDSETLELADDSGTAAQGSGRLGTSNVLSNSQCSVDLSASSISASGSGLTLSVPVTFSTSFAGERSIYMAVQDHQAASAGFSLMGTWTVPSEVPAGQHAPAAESVAPESGSAATQVFGFTVSDQDGASDISVIQALIGSDLNAYNGCYLRYDRPANLLYLATDAGVGWAGSAVLGSAAVLANSRCSVDTSTASVVDSGNALTLSLPLTFTTGFAGDKSVYLMAQDAAQFNSPWTAVGSWTAPSGTPPPTTNKSPQAVSVSPAAGSGAGQTFVFTVSDGDGASTIRRAQMLVSASLTQANACLIAYDRASGTISLADSTGLGIAGSGAVGGGGTLSNSQCSVALGGTSVSESGANMSVSVPITFTAAFAGPRSLYLIATDAAGVSSAWVRVGSWTVVTEPVPPPGTPPVPQSVSPASGTGTDSTFTFAVANDAGGDQVSVIQVLINAGLSGTNACLLYYDKLTNTLFVSQDSGSAWADSRALGSAATISNSQCSVSLGGASVSTTGTTASLTLPITFAPSFGGDRKMYLWAQNSDGLRSNWQEVGSWTVPGGTVNSLPEPVSITPASGTGARQTFEFTASDPDGHQDIRVMLVNINSQLSGIGACQLHYERATNMLYLSLDSGSGWINSGLLGSSRSLMNSQCTVDLSASSASASGNDVTLALALSFPGGFSGVKGTYLAVSDTSGMFSNWVQLGTWEVPSAPAPPPNRPPTPLTVAPSSGSGASATFRFTFSDPEGATDISIAQVLIGPDLSGTGACKIVFDRVRSTVYLLADNGLDWAGEGALGSGAAIANSQCSINLPSAAATASGTTLTLDLPITFTTAFAGAKKINSFATDVAGLTSDWVQLGTWTVQ